MSKNSLTIQINSLEALERLIGGDSQVEIDIRNSVVQAFAEKHLKSVTKSYQIENAIAAIRASIEREIRIECQKLFGEYNNTWRASVMLDEKVKQIIKDSVLTEITSFISSYLKEITSSPEWIKEKIENHIKQMAMISAGAEIRNIVNKIIDEQVAKFKVTLNVLKNE